MGALAVALAGPVIGAQAQERGLLRLSVSSLEAKHLPRATLRNGKREQVCQDLCLAAIQKPV